MDLPISYESHCPDCRTELRLQILRSNAGYYLGRQCRCGPHSRESEYFETKFEATRELLATLGLETHEDDA
jgi:hypothetical protein